jgi:hypothetical protein
MNTDHGIAPRYWGASTNWHPNYYSGGESKLGIVIHHAYSTGTNIYSAFSAGQVSAHYYAYNGGITQYIREHDRAWHTGSTLGNNRYIGIETQNAGLSYPYPIPDDALESVIQCLVGIAQNQGWEQLTWYGDPYSPGTVLPHNWFSSTACPGPYLEERCPWLVEQANKRLRGEKLITGVGGLQMWLPNGTVAQAWWLEPDGDGYYVIRSAIDGKACIDVRNGTAKKGNEVWVYPENKTDAQKWKIKEDINPNWWTDLYKVVEISPKLNESLRLDVVNGNPDSGARLQLWEDNDTLAQKWFINRSPSGAAYIVSMLSNRAIDVINGRLDW